MKKISFQMTVLAAFILSSIAALATDTPTPTAPPVQSGEWFTADFIRTLLAVAAGGVISGIVALGLAIMNNRHAFKLNQQKIDADKEKLKIEFDLKKQELDDAEERQHKSKLKKDKELHCKEIINILHPKNVINGLSEDENATITSALLYISAKDYLPFIQRILETMTNTDCIKNISSYFENKKNFLSEEEIILWSNLRVYWAALIFATQRDLQTGKIPTLDELAELDKKFFEQFYLETKQMTAPPAHQQDTP